MDEKPVPLWQKIAAVVYVLVAAALLIAFRSRLGADFNPPDASRVAPNILAEILTVLVMTPVGVLLWPPTRRRLHRFADRKLGGLHSKLDLLHARHDVHAGQLAELRRSLEELHAKHDAVHPPVPPPPAATAKPRARRRAA